jgi:hypothetical protein
VVLLLCIWKHAHYVTGFYTYIFFQLFTFQEAYIAAFLQWQNIAESRPVHAIHFLSARNTVDIY